ncbi:hypothetical protein [Oceanobacillus manasiensis]|uniref:hypothetical protein n=1 Tax=Oceanobacillus manasiensis TaxID=586413 RepID=UPI0005A9EA13|nr:hypothetical protein [Oceanobacillus manasiensis]
MVFDFGNSAIVLPPFHITVIAIIVIFLLVRWSKQLETKRSRVFFYFLFSTYITRVYTTLEGKFELWIPLGFIAVILYLFLNKRNHPSKLKASILGFCIAIYQLILQYIG